MSSRKNRRFRDHVFALREDQLVRVAANHVIKNGCLRFRVDDVVREIGISHGTCYRHFPSSSALVRMAVAHLDRSFAARLEQPPASVNSHREVLRWAIGEVARAQAYNIMLRARRTTRDLTSRTLARTVWPCCLCQYVCPFEGGRQTSAMIIRLAHTYLSSRGDPINLGWRVQVLLGASSVLAADSKFCRMVLQSRATVEEFINYLFDRLIDKSER